MGRRSGKTHEWESETVSPTGMGAIRFSPSDDGQLCKRKPILGNLASDS